MGIWDRLETVIKSYLHDDAEKIFGRGSHREGRDPDFNSAYEELNDFLNGKDSGKAGNKYEEPAKKQRIIPEELKKDFAELGLKPDASAEECKEAYKKLLKIHHPDHHATHEENMKKATEKSTKVNASYERLMKWFSSK